MDEDNREFSMNMKKMNIYWHKRDLFLYCEMIAENETKEQETQRGGTLTDGP